MTMIERGLAKASLSARQAERFFAPMRPGQGPARVRFVAVLVAVLGVHAAVLGWFLYRDSTSPELKVQAEETPVEIVVEPPKPKPPPEPQKPPPPPPQQRDAMEKPATSAPRAPSKVPVDTKAAAVKTEGPKASPPPRDGQRDPAQPDATAADQPTAAEQPPAKVADDKRDAEALDKANLEAADKPDAPAAKVTPKPKVAAKPDAARQASALTEGPNSFAAATRMMPFPEGKEDDRYLAVVYGMVMSKDRYAGSAAARRGARGTVSVTFLVDPLGQVRYQAVVESSGQADLDAVAMAAVRAAAPFPPPPGSGAQSLIARMSFGPNHP